MKLTNKFNLPATFVNAISRPQYSRGDSQISVTEILSPPQLVQLKRKHEDDLEEDASDRVWSLFGSAVHNILQHGKGDNHVVEERLFTNFEGWSISGAIDLQEVYPEGIAISDYKVTSAWSVQQEKQDWIDQLNCYAWLVERVKGVRVLSLQIIGIVRDWSRRDAAMKEGYPQAPIVTLDIPLWPYADQEEYVRRKLVLHNEAQFAVTMGDQPPLCSPEDMWEKPTTYAVMKEGGKRAKRVFEIKQEAEAFLADQKGAHFIDVRKGGRTRCESFCAVSDFCTQHQQYLSSQGE